MRKVEEIIEKQALRFEGIMVEKLDNHTREEMLRVQNISDQIERIEVDVSEFGKRLEAYTQMTVKNKDQLILHEERIKSEKEAREKAVTYIEKKMDDGMTLQNTRIGWGIMLLAIFIAALTALFDTLNN